MSRDYWMRVGRIYLLMLIVLAIATGVVSFIGGIMVSLALGPGWFWLMPVGMLLAALGAAGIPWVEDSP